MKNEITEVDSIQNKIYEIKGIQVMLDSDLAKLYHVETKRINEAVKNNPLKFSEKFCWKLNDDEINDLWSKFSTANISKMSRTNPTVFTEHGVLMIATILKSEIAMQVSVNIIEAFVSMRKYISNNLIEQKYINNMVIKHDERLLLVEDTLNKLSEKQKINSIFFKGQIFDAYYVLKIICEKAKKEIIIIDNYAGKYLFNLLKDINKEIIIITSNINEIDYKKYKKQYSNITIKNSDLFHDRFIIVDKKEVYHSGSSFKDLGKSCFAINKIEDKKIIRDIIKEIDKT